MTETKHEIVPDVKPSSVVSSATPSLTRTHPLVAVAMHSGNLDPATIREMMQLQRDWEAGEAKRAYTEALVRMKSELPAFIEKKHAADYTTDKGRTYYTFAKISDVLEVVLPVLSRHGFSMTWLPSNTGSNVTVTCRLTHSAGHSEETTMSAPPDAKGGKNPVQAIGSTQTYLQRYTACSMLGIATADMDDADDKKKVTPEKIDASRNLQAVAKLRSVGISIERAQEFVGGKDIQSWTSKDLEDLIGLYKEELALREKTETDAQHEVDAQ